MSEDETPVLQLETERQPDATIVHCTGKVVIDSWAMFTVAVRALIPEGKPILVDLANVSQWTAWASAPSSASGLRREKAAASWSSSI